MVRIMKTPFDVIKEHLSAEEISSNLPKNILEEIYDEERLVLYKERRRDMDSKLTKIIKTSITDEKIQELLKEIDDDNSEY